MNNVERRLFAQMKSELEDGRELVLCSIVSSSGSTPRGSGAKMVLFADGSFAGTVGGGAVEHQCQLLARQSLQSKSAISHGFQLDKNQKADIGMICGGDVEVCFQYFAGGDDRMIRLLNAVDSSYSRHVDSWLVTRIIDKVAVSTDVLEKDSGMLFGDIIKQEDAVKLAGNQPVLSGSDDGLFVEPLSMAGRVYVFGGGHVAQQLVPVISRIGFPTVVFEDRPAFANPSLFPDAEDVVLGSFAEIAKSIAIKAEDYAVVMTRGHMADFELLFQLATMKTRYLGVIGSHHKVALTNRRLIDARVEQERIDHIHSPIGLDIGAQTPAEIAISIAAELISVRAGRDVR